MSRSTDYYADCGYMVGNWRGPGRGWQSTWCRDAADVEGHIEQLIEEEDVEPRDIIVRELGFEVEFDVRTETVPHTRVDLIG